MADDEGLQMLAYVLRDSQHTPEKWQDGWKGNCREFKWTCRECGASVAERWRGHHEKWHANLINSQRAIRDTE